MVISSPAGGQVKKCHESETGHAHPHREIPEKPQVSGVRNVTWRENLQVLRHHFRALAPICSAAGSGAVSGFLVDKGPLTPTSTAISLSAGSVAYGREHAEKVWATVSAGTDVASSMVAVKSGRVTICTITLVNGQGCARHPKGSSAPGC